MCMHCITSWAYNATYFILLYFITFPKYLNNLIILQTSVVQCLYLDQVEAVVVVDCLRGGVCPVHAVEGEAFWFGIWLEGKTTFIGDFVGVET